MKRLLVLNYEFPPLGGGAGNATYYLLKEFSKNSDLTIDLVTSSVDQFRIEQFAPNIKIHYLDIGKKGSLHHQSNKNLLVYSWKAYRYSRKLMRSIRFDLCHAFFGIPCGYIAMKLGLPYIVSLRGSDVPFYSKRFYWLDVLVFRRMSRKIWRRAKFVVANSEKLKELALQSSSNQMISVIPNGVDTESFQPLQGKIPGDTVRLISTGRLIERKGYTYLLEAMRGLKNISLTLIGDGPLGGAFAEIVKKYQLDVTFAGNVPHDKIPTYLQNADVFILPSLNEGMSNAILEAMACGLAIITTDTGGSDELIRENGIIVRKANSEALHRAIQKVISDKSLITSMGRKSRKLAEEMSWQIVAEKYRNVYEGTSRN